MRKDKQVALKLRLKGKSYNEISKKLKIPKSTLSSWLSQTVISSEARNRIAKRYHEGSLRGLIRRNKNQTHQALKRKDVAYTTSRNEIKNFSHYELKLIGAALYWAEGYKRPIIKNGREATYHNISFTNSDPKMIILFLQFLREICKVSDENIKAEVRIYSHMNELKILNFWKKITCLPLNNFAKFYYGVSKSSLGKRKFNRLPHGTIAIRVNNTNLFHRIMGWIEGLAKASEVTTIITP